jgi:outer membrane receptor protein involved in Fe transport
MRRLPLIHLLLGVSAAATASADGTRAGAAAADLPPVTVVATSPLGSDRPVDALAPAAQSADSESLDRSHAVDLGAFLVRRFGSVSVNETQGNPLQPDVNYRGYTASPLLGTPQGLSVYLDGVRLNQPFGDVVSWDLIPRAALERVDLLAGGNPLYGFNSLGGALSLRTKDGYSSPGAEAHVAYGSADRRQVEVQAGGHTESGLYGYVTANRLLDDGWREASPSDARQAFGTIGFRDAATDVALTAARAVTDLTGNGLQDVRLLDAAYDSVFTTPDETRNRSTLLNLRARHAIDDGITVAANTWYRTIRTATLNGDVNEGSLGESLYQPNAAERAALAAAGYSGFPVSGESDANTPFPRWRCIANVLLNDEPNEKCNGLVNRSTLAQRTAGFAAQLDVDREIAGARHRLVLGTSFERSRVRFRQSSQFGYLAPDRTVVPVDGLGAFADGSQSSENAFDARVDLGGRTATRSVFVADSFDVGARLAANLSARHDRSRTTTRDALTPGGGPGSLDGDHVHSRLNPAVGLVYAISPRASLVASYAEASRAPSAIELGCADPAYPCRLPNAMAGDPPLAQVVTKTVELGARGAVGGVRWSAAAFRGDSVDDILFVADDQAGFGYFRNFGRTRRQGVELGVTANAGDLTFGANYTFLDATYRSREVVNGAGNSSNDAAAPGFEGTIEIAPGDRIPLISRHLAKAWAEWRVRAALTLQADLAYVGGMLARGNENGEHRPDGTWYLANGSIGGYTVLNLGAEWRPTNALTAYLQVNNALDRRYATSAQLGTTPFTTAGTFVARPFAGPVIDGERPLLHSTLVAPGAPRAAYVGLRYRWN